MNCSASPGTLRLFVAIEIPESIKETIERAQAGLRDKIGTGSVRWTRREQFHVTLKFLGNVAPASVTGLTEVLTRACADFPPLKLCASGVGFFPNQRRPRVLWVAIREGQGQLERLHEAIQAAVRPFSSEPDEGSFSAHVTLGRVKFLSSQEARVVGETAARMSDLVYGEWASSQAEVLRSELNAEGARYSRVAVLPLGTPACRKPAGTA